MATVSENKSRVLVGKRQYQAPHLLVYGDMARLTAGGSKPGNENFDDCAGQSAGTSTGNVRGTNSNCQE